MHTPTIVAQVMQCCLPFMHAARWFALRDVVVSSANGHALASLPWLLAPPAQSACAIASNALIDS